MRSSFLLLGLLLVSAGSAEAKPLVIFTTFEPFNGWDVNLSHEIAERALSDGWFEAAGIDARICRLPVVYDEASRRALDCIDSIGARPDVVISLGEGDCNIRLETAATNLDDTPSLPDNSGETRIQRVIDPTEPARIGFTLPVDQLYCAFNGADGVEVRPSISAGNFVCNNNGYHLARHFAALGIPYGHIHVPHSGCAPETRDLGRNAALIARMAAIAVDQAQAGAIAAQPATRDEVMQALEALSPDNSACRKGFLEKLLSQYESQT